MDWTPVVTIIATGLVTLSGVWINGRVTARSDQRRIAADERKLEAERMQERERQRREDEAEVRKEGKARQADLSLRGQEVADALLAGLRDVRDFTEVDEPGFQSYFASKWSSRLSLLLRPGVGRITDDAARNRLATVMEALDDFDSLAEQAYGTPSRRFVEQTLLLGVNLAQAIARGQEPDEPLSAEYAKLVQLMSDLDDHRRFQQEMRNEERRDRAVAEREARLVEERQQTLGDKSDDA